MKYFSFEDFNKQQEAMIANVQKLNKLAVANFEKVVALQMDTLRSCTELGLNQMKTFAEVKDPQALQGYVQSQADAVKAMAEKVLADAKTTAELGVSYNQEAQKMTQDAFAKVAKAA